MLNTGCNCQMSVIAFESKARSDGEDCARWRSVAFPMKDIKIMRVRDFLHRGLAHRTVDFMPRWQSVYLFWIQCVISLLETGGRN